MKKLDFNPHKSKEDFRKNYKLHDIAERKGKNLLTQWGFSFKMFGKDNRSKALWEKGEDKPDIILSYKDKSALVDWKAKHHSKWLVNKRAVLSYQQWSKKLGIPALIIFFLFDKENNLLEKRFAVLGLHNYTETKNKQWDKNQTVEFIEDIPKLTKGNLITTLFIK